MLGGGLLKFGCFNQLGQSVGKLMSFSDKFGNVFTSDNKLSSEVCCTRRVGRDAGVGPAVLRRQAEEQDVAREHVILNLK